jgi:hypothetical protein
MTTKKSSKPKKAKLKSSGPEAEKPVALTLKIDTETYVRLSTLRAKERKTAQDILTEALREYLDRTGGMKTLVLSAIVLTSLGMLASCKGTNYGPQTATPAVATPAIPAAAIPTATEVFHLRSECAQLAEKMLEKQKKEEDTTGSDYWSQLSHYSPDTNRCYVQIVSETADRGASDEVLYDGQTGEKLASILYTGKGCPTGNSCQAIGITPPEHPICTGCTSGEDANAYIEGLMGDDRKR